MAEKRVKIPFPSPAGPLVDGSEVMIRESTERWSEIHLEDGTILRAKPSVISAIRMDGKFDPEGNPVYALKAAQVLSVVSSPDHLRKTAVDKVQ